MPGLDYAPSALEAVDGADAVVLVTEWPELVALDWAHAARRMAGNLVIDGRNALAPDALLAVGISYEGVGRSPAVVANPEPTPPLAGGPR
jgi:UDPglucose 6-dehydrogenase